MTLGFGAIGFYDDYLKVTKQSHKGFSGKAPAGDRVRDRRHRRAIVIMRAGQAPASRHVADLPLLQGPVPQSRLVLHRRSAAFVIVGAGNAVNLTDGLDGLAIVPVMIAAAHFGVIAYLAGNAVFADYLQIHSCRAPANSPSSAAR